MFFILFILTSIMANLYIINLTYTILLEDFGFKELFNYMIVTFYPIGLFFGWNITKTRLENLTRVNRLSILLLSIIITIVIGWIFGLLDISKELNKNTKKSPQY